MTIRHDGIIEGCNDIFVKYLFGLSSISHISQLLPQFPTLLKNLKRDDLLQPGLIINNIICRKLLVEEENMVAKLLATDNKKRVLTHTPNNQPLPIMVAMHRDGSAVEVQLQLKLVDSDEEEYALWISFDREVAFKRYGHYNSITKEQDGLVYSPTLTVIPHHQKERSPTVISTSRDTIVKKNSSVSASAVHPISPPLIKETVKDQEINYSVDNEKITIEDYHILDNLGQGAYGLVKLAVKKKDPSQVIFLL
jgi:hypothetical protein